MATGTPNIDHIEVLIDNTPLTHTQLDLLEELIVDTSLDLPSMFVLSFHDDDLKFLEEKTFQVGFAVEIKTAAGDGNLEPLISGEITAIEPTFNRDMTVTITIRGFDLSHRLNRGTRTRVFVDIPDSDIVKAVGSEAGLRVEAEDTGSANVHVFQDNITDLAFLQQLAYRHGFEVFVNADTLYFRRPTGERGEIELEWGRSLLNFTPRLSLARQISEVVVKGWDPEAKQEVTGSANTGRTAPELNERQSASKLAAEAFSEAKTLVVRRVVRSQDDADDLAQAILDKFDARFIEADGVADGNPELLAGKIIKVSSVGEHFSGRYIVTSATHIYGITGYETEFRVEGPRPHLMSEGGNTTSSAVNGQDWGGVVSAMVTNNNDPDNMGRVKLKFPWMDSNLESHWARIVAPGAGPDRGIYWLPEINDEVLVAFEHGDFNYPYVLGGMWNGQDAPAEEVGSAVKSGEVTTRSMKTRKGHVIRMVDEDGSQMIEIVDAEGKHSIVLDIDGNKIAITTDGDLELTSNGKTNVTASDDVIIEGSNAITVNGGSDIKLQANTNVSISASGEVKIQGSAVSIN